MHKITPLIAALSLSQIAFGGSSLPQDFETPNLNTREKPQLGDELANSSVKLKSGKILHFFASLTMITDSPFSEYPLIRIRLMDPTLGKEKYKIISIEEDAQNKKSEGKFVDRTDPKRRLIIGDAFDTKTLLKAYGEHPEIFFKDKVIGKFITQEAILLHGYKSEDMESLYADPITLRLIPSNIQDNTKLRDYEVDPNTIKDSVSYTYEIPESNDATTEIKYGISMGRLISETLGIFSRIVMHESQLDPENPRIVTNFNVINSDVKAVITYFGQDKDTGSKSYHILLERDGDFRPISSTQIIEEKDGRVNIISHDSNSGKRYDRFIGVSKTPIDFTKISEGYNGSSDYILTPTDKKIIEAIMKPFSSTFKANLDKPTLAIFTNYQEHESEALLPIHQQAITYAQRRAKSGANLHEIIPDMLERLGLPWRMNPTRRFIYLRNPEKPKELKEE